MANRKGQTQHPISQTAKCRRWARNRFNDARSITPRGCGRALRRSRRFVPPAARWGAISRRGLSGSACSFVVMLRACDGSLKGRLSLGMMSARKEVFMKPKRHPISTGLRAAQKACRLASVRKHNASGSPAVKGRFALPAFDGVPDTTFCTHRGRSSSTALAVRTPRRTSVQELPGPLSEDSMRDTRSPACGSRIRSAPSAEARVRCANRVVVS